MAMLIVGAQRGLLILTSLAFGRHRWSRWDADWYLDVATHGYLWPPPAGAHGAPTRPNMAFFPMLPVLARWLHEVTTLPLEPTLLGVALLGLPLAAWGIAAVGNEIGGRRTGLVLVTLWGAAPRALVTIMPYTEALFTAFAAWCLYATLRRHWWRAAFMCAMAGLTRSSAGILLLSFGLGWIWARRKDLAHVRTWLQGLGLALVAASGLVAYLGYVAHRTGRWDGYVRIQRIWVMQMGSPLVAWHQIPRMWHSHFDWATRNYSVIVVLAALVLTAAALAVRPPLPIWVYTVASVGWTWAAQNYFWAKPRFLLPVFPLGLAPALLLARIPRWVSIPVIIVLTGLECVTDAMMWAGHTSP